jgi:hypothetical protein
MLLKLSRTLFSISAAFLFLFLSLFLSYLFHSLFFPFFLHLISSTYPFQSQMAVVTPDHTPRHTFGETPLTTHNTHNRHTSMPPAGVEHAIPANDRPQAYFYDGAATENALFPSSKHNS